MDSSDSHRRRRSRSPRRHHGSSSGRHEEKDRRHRSSHRSSHESSRHHSHRRSRSPSKHHRSGSSRRKIEEEEEAERKELKAAIKSDSSDDDDEGEWVIKADSGAYNYEAQQTQVKPESMNKEEAPSSNTDAPERAVTVSELNVLKSQILAASLAGDTAKAERLQLEYDKLVGGSNATTADDNSSGLKILDSVEIRQLHEQQKKSSEDMSIADMVREEKLSGPQGSATELDMARQIGKDSGYEQDSDYVFDNAEKLSRAHVLSADDARKKVLERTRRLNTISDECALCVTDQEDSARGRKVVPISMGTRVYLAEAAEPALTKGVSVIVPMEHHRNTLECDDDEWEEIRNFMKCLTRMWSGYNRSVIFYENAVPTGGSGDRMHACIYAVPVSAEVLDKAPAVFRESMETSDEEWSVHRKVINTMQVAAAAAGTDAARFAFRSSIAKEAPYFHVWFNINGGLGHIVEDREQWPRGDLFAREILGNLLRSDIVVIRKRTRWPTTKPKFVTKWPEFDWTLQLG